MSNTINYKEVFQLAESKGFEDFDLIAKYTKHKKEQLKLSEIKIITWIEENELLGLSLIQKWLRDTHKIFICTDIESIGSDEWVSTYKITYLPKQFWDAKRRMQHFIYLDSSLKFSGGATFSGGWDTIEEALLEGINEALQLIP